MSPRDHGPAPILDEVSKRIIEQLQEDGRRPYAAIGKAVGLSEAAVRQRVQRLLESGVVQIVAVTDPLQVGFSRQAITYADTGLALLPAGDMSDLAVRMRTLRAVVSTNVGGIDAATAELTRVVEAVRDRPLALGCVLRDRGWLNFRDGNPDQALDDLLRAYALLRRNASKEEAMVAAGRLSMAQFSVRDYPQALSLVDETVAFFREQKAPVRLAPVKQRTIECDSKEDLLSGTTIGDSGS